MDNTERGFFGQFGGRFVPETLISPLEALSKAYDTFLQDKSFLAAQAELLSDYVGRPSPLYFAQALSEKMAGAKIYLKREDLNHTGAHKINNTVGQVLLAKHMGKTRVIAETGAGQHGVATATIAARLGLECCVFMGAVDIERQALNVKRMELLGASVVAVESGSRTLKDAMNEALRDWVTRVDDTFYVIGTVAGPHPYPTMVRDFQAIIGHEVRRQLKQKGNIKPHSLIACVGGGSNAIGLFHEFVEDKKVKLIGVEAGGKGLQTEQHAAPLNQGRVGVLHGNRTYLMTKEDGQIMATHSISAGLDYPGVGPEHAYLMDSGRAEYVSVTDDEAVEAFHLLTKTEGIIPALESSHAIAYAAKLARTLPKTESIIVCLSGRGDKDLQTIIDYAD